MQRLLLRGGRVVLHSVVGGVLVIAGLVMLVTPGPGVVTIVLGLAVLAREYDWADRLKRVVLGRVRDASTVARARLAARRGKRGADAVTELRPPATLDAGDSGVDGATDPATEVRSAG